jgi:hypothetical protein
MGRSLLLVPDACSISHTENSVSIHMFNHLRTLVQNPANFPVRHVLVVYRVFVLDGVEIEHHPQSAGLHRM